MNAIAAELAPISLAALDERASLQRRIDHKYIVPQAMLAQLLPRLADSHAVLEIEGGRVFTYSSVYFDSESLVTYRAHAQRRRRRFKCRTREYVESSLRYFEVKLKGGRGETVKERIEDGEALGEQLSAPAQTFLRECLGSHYGMELNLQLHPMLTVRYRRMTIGALDGSERVTVDVDLSLAGSKGGSARLAPDWAIIETKSEHGHGAGDRYLRSLGLRPVDSCTKYCIGIALTRPDVRNNELLRVTRRYFRVTR